MPEIILRGCKVIQFENRQYTGKDGQAKTYRSVLLQYQKGVFKLGVERDVESSVLERAVDSECNVTCALTTFGDKLEPTLRVSGIEVTE